MPTSLALLAASLATAGAVLQFPVYPFQRQLSAAANSSGDDVLLLQRLLGARAAAWCGADFLPAVASVFDDATGACLALFQAPQGLPASGVLDAATASAVLRVLGPDGYVDDGVPPAALGYAYKVLVVLPSANRSVEAQARLIAANGSELFSFTVRLHGAEGYPVPAWPSYNDSDSGLNQFTGDGATPTGLAEFDLNSPECEYIRALTLPTPTTLPLTLGLPTASIPPNPAQLMPASSGLTR